MINISYKNASMLMKVIYILVMVFSMRFKHISFFEAKSLIFLLLLLANLISLKGKNSCLGIVDIALFSLFYFINYAKIIIRFGITFPVSWFILAMGAGGGGFSEEKLERTFMLSLFSFIFFCIYLYFYYKINRPIFSVSNILSLIIMINYIFFSCSVNVDFY